MPYQKPTVGSGRMIWVDECDLTDEELERKRKTEDRINKSQGETKVEYRDPKWECDWSNYD